VFARLLVGGEDHGIHALIIEPRDEHGGVPDGITIDDCGEKLGLNGGLEASTFAIWIDPLELVRVVRTARCCWPAPSGSPGG
jgi:acyl-CoA oxidase